MDEATGARSGEAGAGDSVDPGPADSPVDAIRQLIADAQAAAASETALIKLSGQFALRAIKAMSIWGIIAVMCGFVGLLSLAIGALLALAQTIGVWLAMLIVPGVLFAVAALAAVRVRARSRDMRTALDALLP